MKGLAKIISTIFHPLVMPIVCLIYILYSPTPWSGLPFSYKSLMMLYIGLGTSLAPLLCIALLMVLRLVKNVEMPSRNERFLPLILSCLSAAITCYIITTNSHAFVFPALIRMVEGITFMFFLALLITPFWKISLHSMGMGGLMSFLIVLGISCGQDFTIAACVVVALTGLVCWARLYLEAHTPMQLVVGYLVGALTMTIAFVHP